MPGHTRRQLLAAGMGANGGAGGPVSVTDRLQRLIRVELLVLFCYEQVLAGSVLSPRARATLTPFIAHERAHVAALETRLRARGGSVPGPPADVRSANHDLAHHRIGGRLGQLRGDLDAVRLLLALEQTAIGAYFVALTKLGEPDLVQLICQIMAADAQHDAVLGLLLPPGRPDSAVPYAFVQGL